MTLDELEQQILIAQITDSYTRRSLVSHITAFNKEAKKNSTQAMTTAYILRKRLPSFAAYLERVGINLDTDLHNNFRIALAGLDVHLPDDADIPNLGYFNVQSRYVNLYTLFTKHFLEANMSFKIFNTVYTAVPVSSSNPRLMLTVNGRTDITPLDAYRFLILLEEI